MKAKAAGLRVGRMLMNVSTDFGRWDDEAWRRFRGTALMHGIRLDEAVLQAICAWMATHSATLGP